MSLPKRASKNVARPSLHVSGASFRPFVHMVMGVAPTAQDQRVVQELLRRRLLLVTTILAGGIFAGLLASLLSSDAGASGGLPSLLSRGGGAVILAGLSIGLWKRPALPLGILRTIELVLLGSLLILLASTTSQQLVLSDPQSQPVPSALSTLLGDRPWTIFANGGVYMSQAYQGVAGWLILNFGLVMVSYGIFIPNTWKRCLAVLMGILLLADVSVARACQSSALRSQLIPFVGLMTYWLAVFSAVALYGCHKLTLLRNVEREVREVGQYMLGEKLGRGGMGEVFLARHRMLRRPCAVKLIRADHAGSSAALGRFEREVQSMAALTHPNTVEVYDYGRTEAGTLYYAMEYLPGLSLESLVKAHGPLPPGRCVYLLRQVCRALREAHMAGLVHRDVKPANISVTERGGERDVIKLLDFGLVRIHDAFPKASLQSRRNHPPGVAESQATEPNDAELNETRAGSVLGTPAFMAPEQIEGEAEPRSDLYSLGVVAYYVLTARTPFVRATLAELCDAHLRDEPPKPSSIRVDIPGDLEAVVLRCLAKHPADRFSEASELESALAHCECAAGWDSTRAADWWRSVSQAESSDTDSSSLAFDATLAAK